MVATRHHRRRVLELVDRDAEIIFVRRDLAQTDLQRAATELGAGWVTSIEQTVLDLAARPELGGVPSEAKAAIQALLPRADQSMLGDLAARQRRTATLHRLLKEARGA